MSPPEGEVLGTVSPVQDISTELMATPAEATTGLLVPSKTLQLLFGKVPEGKVNTLAKANASPAPKPSPESPSAPSSSAGSKAPSAPPKEKIGP